MIIVGPRRAAGAIFLFLLKLHEKYEKIFGVSAI